MGGVEVMVVVMETDGDDEVGREIAGHRASLEQKHSPELREDLLTTAGGLAVPQAPDPLEAAASHAISVDAGLLWCRGGITGEMLAAVPSNRLRYGHAGTTRTSLKSTRTQQALMVGQLRRILTCARPDRNAPVCYCIYRRPGALQVPLGAHSPRYLQHVPKCVSTIDAWSFRSPALSCNS